MVLVVNDPRVLENTCFGRNIVDNAKLWIIHEVLWVKNSKIIN